jgi:signal transduction histidine kinase
MTVEREGEFPREDREAVETLGLQLALGIENARLAIRQRRFAEELREKVAAATEELRELDQAKSDFVSLVSHELRTPLTSIQGFSELLLTRPQTPERARQFLTAIHQEAERIGRIVRDLLDLSRIELGRGFEPHCVPLDLRQLIGVNVELFRGQTALHQILWDAPEDLPRVFADQDAVDQVLKNLLSNAVKYSPQGGTVRVWAVPSVVKPGTVELGVEDQGVGIPPPVLPKIFEKYYRVSHPATAHTRGLGIGLALVKALVETQGGTIDVESREGKGSRFVVRLPLASGMPTAQGRPSADRGASPERERGTGESAHFSGLSP